MMNKVLGSDSSVLGSYLSIFVNLFGAAAGALIGLLAGERHFVPLALMMVGSIGILGVPLLRSSCTRGALLTVPIQEVLRWGFLIMLPAAIVGPVASWPGFRSAYAFRLLYVGLCFGIVTWLLLQRRFALKLEIGGFILFLGFWVVWATGSLVWAADKLAGMKYLIFLVMMISLSVGTVLAANSLKMLRIALLILFVTFLAGIGIGMLEILADFRLPTSALIRLPERFQWASTSWFYNQNNFATYITLWLPFLLTAAFFTRRRRVLAATGICAFLSVVCLMRAGSKVNLLALVPVSLGLLLVLVARRGASMKWRQVALGIMVLLVAGSAIYLTLSGPFATLKLPDIGLQRFQFSGLMDPERSGNIRLSLIQNGLAALANYGFLGVGPGNAEYHVQRMPGTERVNNLHNWWAEILVNGGVFVLVGYLFYYAGLLYNLFQVALRAKNEVLAYAGASLFVALVGYTVGAMGPSTAIHFVPMWIHFGLSLAVISLFRKRDVKAWG